MEFNLFGYKFSLGQKEDNLVEDSYQEFIQEESLRPTVVESVIRDITNADILGQSEVVGITESVVYTSPESLKKMIDSNEIKLSSLLDSLKLSYNDHETFKENEDMAKDTIIGSAMELMSDDCCMVEPSINKIVNISSENPKTAEFLNTFLTQNVGIENRVWEWAFEIVKHGDFKLRRMEYKGKDNVKSVYYENVTEGYKVSRIEYLGTVLGYLDSEDGANTLEPKEAFVHFLSTKLPNRKKIKVKISAKNKKALEVSTEPRAGETPKDTSEITCYKVAGVSLVDNARYIYRIVNLLDNMLIMSRVARSTQYNLVKVEVGNSSPSKTQEILMDVRRRVEGSTKINKGKGMRTDPSPIPVNSNVYIPVREGKGDIVIESVNESVDVKSIVDIDYFRNKEFATIKTPKVYLGFEESARYSTRVALLDGLTYCIGDMAKDESNFIGKGILTCAADGSIVPAKILGVRKTKENVRFMRITLDNGEFEDFTPEHLFMMRDGTFKEVKDLKTGDSLMPFYTKVNDRGYTEIKNNKTLKWEPIYRIVGESLYGGKMPKGYQVHHKNEDKKDNDFNNLEPMEGIKHCLLHNKTFVEKGHRSHIGKPLTKEHKKKLSLKLKGREMTIEHKQKISKALSGRPPNNPFKKGEENIMKDNTTVSKQKNSLRDYYDNGGTTWKKKSDTSKVREWSKMVNAHRWDGEDKKQKQSEYMTSEIERVCSLCGKTCVSNSSYAGHRAWCGKVMSDTSEVSDTSEAYNHKVVSVVMLDIVEDSYDLLVDNETHTFPLASGIFVHNSLPGSLGNNSLVKLDIRYARNVQRAQNILNRGIKELCNNYLVYRGRPDEVDNFNVDMRSVSSAEDSTKIEDFMAHVSVFDSLTTVLTEFGDYVDKSKLFNYLFKMMGVHATDIASEAMIKNINKINKGEKVDPIKSTAPVEEEM